jgi:hypothetical protein
MDITAAVEWCEDHQAVVTFSHIYGYHRVTVRVGGGYEAERYSLPDAVKAVQAIMHDRCPELHPAVEGDHPHCTDSKKRPARPPNDRHP